MVTTLADTQTPAPRNVSSDSPPVLSELEVILFAVGGFILIVIFITIIFCWLRMRNKKKSRDLNGEVKYDVARESVAIEPQSFAPRTASVSSTGSTAAMFMRQRSIRGRLESRLTQVKIGPSLVSCIVAEGNLFLTSNQYTCIITVTARLQAITLSRNTS